MLYSLFELSSILIYISGDYGNFTVLSLLVDLVVFLKETSPNFALVMNVSVQKGEFQQFIERFIFFNPRGIPPKFFEK